MEAAELPQGAGNGGVMKVVRHLDQLEYLHFVAFCHSAEDREEYQMVTDRIKQHPVTGCPLITMVECAT